MLRQIEKILDEQIRPALSSHSGNIELIDVDNGIVYVQFKGGCHGCSSSTATLKQGVEKILKEKFPEIKEVLDITDHKTGENPYM
jgi:Fe-S cluster biogenesis protein NfuA